VPPVAVIQDYAQGLAGVRAANREVRLDVSDVKFIAFAPQDKVAGKLSLGRFVLLQ
jgi:hypothetical protein